MQRLLQGAGSSSTQSTSTVGTKPLQRITENTSAVEPVLGKSLLPEDILIHALMQITKQNKKQAFNLFDGIFSQKHDLKKPTF